MCYSEDFFDKNDDYCSKAVTPNEVWNFIYQQDGVPAKNLPDHFEFKGKKGVCHRNEPKNKIHFENYIDIQGPNSMNVEDIKMHLSYQPLSVAISTKDFECLQKTGKFISNKLCACKEDDISKFEHEDYK